MQTKAKISRNLALFLFKSLLKEDRKLQPNEWGQEIKVLGSIYLQYPNEDFWKTLNLGFKLNTFIFFKSDEGKNEIEKKWRQYLFNKNLDKKPEIPIFDDIKSEPELKPKTILDWIDE